MANGRHPDGSSACENDGQLPSTLNQSTANGHIGAAIHSQMQIIPSWSQALQAPSGTDALFDSHLVRSVSNSTPFSAPTVQPISHQLSAPTTQCVWYQRTSGADQSQSSNSSETAVTGRLGQAASTGLSYLSMLHLSPLSPNTQKTVLRENGSTSCSSTEARVSSSSKAHKIWSSSEVQSTRGMSQPSSEETAAGAQHSEVSLTAHANTAATGFFSSAISNQNLQSGLLLQECPPNVPQTFAWVAPSISSLCLFGTQPASACVFCAQTINMLPVAHLCDRCASSHSLCPTCGAYSASFACVQPTHYNT